MPGQNLTEVHDALRLRRTFGVLDDFGRLDEVLWGTIQDRACSIAVLNGILRLEAFGSDNAACYVFSQQPLFTIKYLSGIVVEVLVAFDEANTNAANLIFGLMSEVDAFAERFSLPLQDDGGGPRADFTGAVLYKPDGTLYWQTASSLGTTQTLSTSTSTAGTSATYKRLRVEINPSTTTTATATYWVDGLQLRDNSLDLIEDTITYADGLPMQLVIGVKNGTSGLPERLLVDYAAWEFTR